MGPTVIHDQANRVAEALKELIPACCGVLLFGSSVEKKLGRPSKDLDVVAISNSTAWGTCNTRIADAKVELFWRRLDKVCQAVVAHRDFFDTRNIAAGKIINQPENLRLFPKLKRIAEVNWSKGPLRPGPSSPNTRDRPRVSGSSSMARRRRLSVCSSSRTATSHSANRSISME